VAKCKKIKGKLSWVESGGCGVTHPCPSSGGDSGEASV